jgi:hypothetical protein
MPRRIKDIYGNAERQIDTMGGSETFIKRLYSGSPTVQLTRLKEDWIIGRFSYFYHKRHRPMLVWAAKHLPRTQRADFSAYNERKGYLCDVEVTAIFPRPTTKSPHGIEDFVPYPISPDSHNPLVTHVYIHRPPTQPPYAYARRVIEKHLRDAYPPYWLVIYDNEFRAFRGITKDDALRSIEEIFAAMKTRGKLPPNLKQVWILYDDALARLSILDPCKQ